MTPKQERFCLEYMKDLNATQAAKRAGYSEATAYSIGQRLLKDVEIINLIDGEKTKRTERIERNIDDILKEIRETRTLALELGQTSAAIRASELESKLMGLFIEKRELSGPGGAPMQSEVLNRYDLSKLDDVELQTFEKLLDKATIGN